MRTPHTSGEGPPPKADGAADVAMEQQPDALAVVAHELKGPLAAISQLAAHAATFGVPQAVERDLALIRAAAEQLQGLASGLLDERAAAELAVGGHPEIVRTRDLMQFVADLERPVAGEGVTLQVDIGEDVPEDIMVDRTRLTQVLINLTINALKASSRGEIRLGVKRASGGLDFSVIDQGPGLPEGFEIRPFAASSGGHGLGLWICQSIATVMGGRLSHANNVPEPGATFTLHLPETTRAFRQAMAPAAEADPVALPLSGKTALVIDDNPVNRCLMVTILSSFDMEVMSVANGAEALAAVARRKPDVIFSDMMLVGETGADVLARLKDLLGVDCPPAIVVSSAQAGPLGAPVISTLLKPFTPSRIYRALEGAFHQTTRRSG